MPHAVLPPQPISSIYAGCAYVPPGAARVVRAEWQRPRWWDWQKHRKLKCPAGHHIRNNCEIDEDGAALIRCTEPIEGSRGGCGLWIWAARWRGSSHLVIEVSERDMQEMSKLRTGDEKLDYLGIADQLKRVR